MSSVRLENIIKYYEPTNLVGNEPRVPALDHISLEIHDGETVSVVGPSGCGKSTFLKAIAGLEFPDSGQIFYNNGDVTHIPPQERGVGMVFQDYALYPSREGQGNLSYYFEVRKKTEAEKEQRLRETAEMMGIGFDLLLSRNVDTLSGGERQRVGIARCIVRDPNVFLMDEPICNLDAKLRERTRIEMKRLLTKFGITTIYVTHDQQEAIFMGDRIVVMRAGRVEQFDTFDALYYTPANLFVASLIGTPPISILRVQLGGDMLRSEDGTSWIIPHDLMNELPAGALRLGIRPEGWLVSLQAGEGVPMNVTHIERLYTERAAFVHGNLAGSPVNALVSLDFADVKQVFLQPDWERAYFFHATEETPLRLPGVPDLF
ncbi:MAG: ABC transporter ATP-binding protein [Anaerolineaceae bacterium]|nr:ABC transporter ATP-binding protein [Anaerolineaceae bacterium]